MSPQVSAALIAAGVSLISLAGTVAVAIAGFRTTTKVTDKNIAAQLEQLTEQRARTLNERFATAADRLGSDKPPAVRLAGVHAMAGLADDWLENRQTCINVLCAYLRMPYEPDPGEQAPAAQQIEYRASREVRHTIMRVITQHLMKDATVTWQGLDFDFTGAIFDGGNFDDAQFSGGEVSFLFAEFSAGIVGFRGTKFSGGRVDFRNTRFSGGLVSFSGARFSDGLVNFRAAGFSGSWVDFRGADFSGGIVGFSRAGFSGGAVDFSGAGFSGGAVDFTGAGFSGGRVSFSGAGFSGGRVDFSGASDWSHPPEFSWDGAPPSGVLLPT